MACPKQASFSGSDQRAGLPPSWGVLDMMAGGGYQNVVGRDRSIDNASAEVFQVPTNSGVLPQIFMEVKRTWWSYKHENIFAYFSTTGIFYFGSQSKTTVLITQIHQEVLTTSENRMTSSKICSHCLSCMSLNFWLLPSQWI